MKVPKKKIPNLTSLNITLIVEEFIEIQYVSVSEKQNPALYWFTYNSAC